MPTKGTVTLIPVPGPALAKVPTELTLISVEVSPATGVFTVPPVTVAAVVVSKNLLLAEAPVTVTDKGSTV